MTVLEGMMIPGVTKIMIAKVKWMMITKVKRMMMKKVHCTSSDESERETRKKFVSKGKQPQMSHPKKTKCYMP